MIIDWPIFLGAVVVLWIPASLLYSATARERLSDYQSSRFRIERMAATWQHWLDLLRGFAGTFLLVEVAIQSDPASTNELYFEYAVMGVVLVIAVAAQTVFRKTSFYFTAPVFFLWGVSFALAPWISVLFALVFSAIITRMIDHVDLKFPLMAGLLGVAGYFQEGFSVNLALACVLLVTPLVLAYASMHTMVCYSSDLALE